MLRLVQGALILTAIPLLPTMRLLLSTKSRAIWVVIAVFLPFWIAGACVSLYVHKLAKRERSAHAVLANCWNCQYDLTGNSSGRCPECGFEFRVADRQNESGSSTG